MIALVAGLTAFGLTPRCVLKIPPREDRLRRLHDLLSTCQASVHDLSRVGTYGSSPRCARFNMPFELGLAVADRTRTPAWASARPGDLIDAVAVARHLPGSDDLVEHLLENERIERMLS